MAVQLLVGPTEEPLDLAFVKVRHLRIDHNEDDDYIEGLIVAAREFAETVTRRAFVTQTWKYVLDLFPAVPSAALSWQANQDQFWLPFPPLQSVTNITFIDSTGASTVVSPSTYIVDTASEPGRVALATGNVWPHGQLRSIAGVSVTFVAGYGLAAAVPRSIKQAMLLMIGEWYENREDVVVDKQIKSVELPRGADVLLWRNSVREVS